MGESLPSLETHLHGGPGTGWSHLMTLGYSGLAGWGSGVSSLGGIKVLSVIESQRSSGSKAVGSAVLTFLASSSVAETG